MKKLVALYKTPSDTAAFMAYYRETHLPLVMRIPGLLRTELTLIDRTLIGETGNYLLADMFFADEDSLRSAMCSAENAATGADLGVFADGIATIMTGTVIES